MPTPIAEVGAAQRRRGPKQIALVPVSDYFAMRHASWYTKRKVQNRAFS
jgi:hypothetical protein